MAKLKSNDFIRFPNKQELEKALREDSEKQASLDELPRELQEKVIERLNRSLESASEADVNTPPGETKIKVGNWHIRLRFSYWEAVRTAADIILLTFKLSLAADILAGVDAGLNAIDALIHRIKHLNTNELQVYEAIVDVVHSKWDRTIVIPGASKSEILALYKKRSVLLTEKTLEGILLDLEKHKVIDGRDEPDEQKYYFSVF